MDPLETATLVISSVALVVAVIALIMTLARLRNRG